MTTKNKEIPKWLKKSTIEQYYDSNEETWYIWLNERVRNIIYNEIRLKSKNINFNNEKSLTTEQINEKLENWLFDWLEYVVNLESEEKTIAFVKIINDIEKYPSKWMKWVIADKIWKAELLVNNID